MFDLTVPGAEPTPQRPTRGVLLPDGTAATAVVHIGMDGVPVSRSYSALHLTADDIAAANATDITNPAGGDLALGAFEIRTGDDTPRLRVPARAGGFSKMAVIVESDLDETIYVKVKDLVGSTPAGDRNGVNLNPGSIYQLYDPGTGSAVMDLYTEHVQIGTDTGGTPPTSGGLTYHIYRW